MRLAALLIGAGGMVAFPAWAAGRSPADEARATLRMAADCAAGNNVFYRYGVQLRAFMAMSPFDPAITKVEAAGLTFDDLNHHVRDPRPVLVNAIRDCMFERRPSGDSYIASLRFTPILLRGMMYRGLYRQQFGRGEDTEIKAAEGEPAWRIASDYGFTPLQQFGECVVQRDAAGSRTVVYAPAGSEEERAGYARLAPALSGCLPPRVTLRFSKSLIEGLLAEGLFHLSGGSMADPRKAKS